MGPRFRSTMIPYAILVAVTLSASLLAQVKPGKQKPAPEPTLRSITERLKNSQRNYSKYSRALSWSLFEACDANGDDRLNLFEASRALPGLGNTRDPGPFRALDTNRDGFIQWPEFDSRFADSIRREGIFACKPARTVHLVRDPTAAGEKAEDLAPHQQILELVDTDQDEAISPEELAEFIRLAGLPPEMATKGFPALDTDRSGKLTRNEFEKILSTQLPKIFDKRSKVDDQKHQRLPEDIRAADKDHNGVIDAAEMNSSLRLLQPSLTRWCQKIIQDADRNGTGSLGHAELLRAAKRAAVKPTQKGKQPTRSPKATKPSGRR